MGKIATQIRLDEYTYSKLKSIAEIEMRSINAQMEYFIVKMIAQWEKDNPEQDIEPIDPNLFQNY